MCTRNLIWVATKMQVMVNRYPTWGDVVQIDTWVAPSGKNGMRRDWLLRDYYTGKTLTRASSTSYLSLINSNLPSFQKIVMDTPAFDRISKLTCNKTSWTIKVRLTRLWKSINAITGDFKGYNMILLDDDKTHIHAFAGLDFVNEMDDVPEERKVYNISEFNVDDAKYSYVAVSNKSEIYFLKRTNMTLIEEEDDMIPKYKFELVSLNALKLKVGNTKILTDLIGLVVNVLPMQSRNTPTGPKDILLIDITDGRLNNANEPIIVDDIPSATHFTVKKIDTYNLKQISDLRSSDLQNLEVICHVLVCSIDAQSRWWFYSCDSCPEELSFVDDTYKCECGKIVSYPDKRPGLTTSKSLLEEGRGDQLPEKLMNITRKRLKLTLSLNAKNLTYGNSVYFASDVVEEVEASENPTTKELLEMKNTVPTSHLEGCAVHDTPEIKSPSNKRTLKKDDGSNKITIVLSHTFRLCDLFFQDYVLVLIWFLV
ncbi:hypothetical protein DCAR_0102048 [Daucus carota subsp. sativus]|uniref:Acyl-[acyl-carrier-protein] hydrolase n=1 Tax=Daucus carota subsp. sativus TaxID=79200 RepID=A0A166GU35_DAUCS|nr:hypothetical protein DCAR_0102048 [Daucus carota subsp. sativus]